MVDAELSKKLLGVTSSVLRPPIGCRCLRDTEAVEALAKEGDEVVSPPFL